MNAESDQRRNRRHLHRIPVALPSDQAIIYFVTLCCAERRRIFVTPEAVSLAVSSLIDISNRYHWHVHQVCLMPDHVHLFATPMLHREQSLSGFIKGWKSSSKQRLARSGMDGDIWQREFFDHLLRSGESLQEKWNYVAMNPVRAGLCTQPDEYPYLGTPEQIVQRI